MRNLWIIISIVLFPLTLWGQQQAEYNQKGDEAMKRLDYSDARMWYEEGVAACDLYSIKQLTAIWIADEDMRSSMYSLMNKCRNCLEVMANEQDTTAMNQLIIYYTEGIGTSRNNALVKVWQERLDVVRHPVELSNTYEPQKTVRRKPHERMHFFFGYTYSMESPVGLTIGGVKSRVGWYTRFKTNLKFDPYENGCKGTGELQTLPKNDAAYYFTGEKKVNSYMGTAGIVIKCTSWLYASAGAGYGSRELLYEYAVVNPLDYQKVEKAWAKHQDNSYKGVVADVDLMVNLGPIFLSGGCNTLNFKYIDVNVGIGLFF